MKKAREIIAFILSAMLIISSSALPCYALDNNQPLMRKNPFYAGEEIFNASLDSLDSEQSITKKLNSKTYYSDGEALYKIIRNNLVKRKTDFTVYYLTKNQMFYENALDVVENMFLKATDDAISQSPVDGDYIRWAVESYGLSQGENDRYFNGEYKDGYYYYTLELSFGYYDSAEDEKAVDKVVNSFISSINTDELTDYQIVERIHDYICSKTTYDDGAAFNIKDVGRSVTAYGALVGGKCVCQGYAVAFYRLCKELGYSARFVSSDASWGCHAWNIVQLDGKYYFVDTTWDDALIDEGEKNKAHTYFLVNYDNIRKNDSYKSEHAFDSKFYDEEYFMENYREKLDNNNYDATDKSLFSQSIITLSKKSFVYSGSSFKPAVSVQSEAQQGAYSVSYQNNKNLGMASVNIMSGDGETLLSHRNFVIVPKKMSALSLAESGRATNSITLKWSKPSENISGCNVEIYRYGKWNAVKTLSASATSVKIDSLSSASAYKFRIRSFIKVSSRNYYGAYSSVYKTATKPRTPAISSLSSKSKSITVKFKEVNCSGYEIQYSTNKSMKNAKTVKASSSAKSKKLSALKKGKRYYIRVRAYKDYTTASGKSCRCCSAWSAKKSVICK
ncbi:MAG: hypothetical protein E7570_05915 [Ruminococcaceae bacterium]|nr:hypothetical protein [Oscillospiraceae bacterium]